MAVQRKEIMVRHSGGTDRHGNHMSIERSMWIDVPTKPDIPNDTPHFLSVHDDAEMQEAERRWQHLLENGPKAAQAVDDAYRNYQASLNNYAMGTATMEQVEEAKALLSKAEAMRDAVQRSLLPVRSAVVEARKHAIEENRAAFQKEVDALIEERSNLLARLKEIDNWYADTVHSFQQTDNPYAPFIATRLDGKGSVSHGHAVAHAIERYIYAGLDLPDDEAEQVPAPRNVLASWRVPR